MTQSADVVVIGGGVNGASTAFHLAQRGLKVTLLERSVLAGGASGADLSTFYGGAVGGRAIGGPVGGDAGGIFQIAENRPEVLDTNGRRFLVMGKQRGWVDPNPRLAAGGGGGQTVVQNFHLSGPMDRRTQAQIGAEASRGLALAAARNN